MIIINATLANDAVVNRIGQRRTGSERETR
jgi:hypothetical protein